MEPNSPLDYLFENVRNFGNNIALIGQDFSMTHSEFYNHVLSISKKLSAIGIKPCDRIGIASSNYQICFSGIFAIWILGSVAVPINMMLPAPYRTKILKDCSIKACIVDDPSILEGSPDIEPLLIENLIHDFSISSNSVPPTHFGPHNDAMIMYTSGTTGVPKGVRNSHRALAMNAYLTANALSLESNDRILINTPAYYTSAIVHLLTVFSKGGSIVVHNGFLFGLQLIELVSKHNCTCFGGAPTHFSRIFETLDPSEKKPDSLRFMMSSGDHLSPYLIKKALSFFQELDIYCVYGLSEVAGRLCILEPNMLSEKIGSVGKPLPGMSIEIRDENSQKRLARNETGEVYVSGPLLMAGYLDNEKLNKELITDHGFKTGDYGYLDDDGYLFLEGRRDDVFKSGGEKVSTVLIQQTLSTFEIFSDIAVIPDKDEMMGKVPIVFYSLREGTSLDKRIIVKKLRKLLPRTHIPKKFIHVKQIPRTGSGKIVRNLLAEESGVDDPAI